MWYKKTGFIDEANPMLCTKLPFVSLDANGPKLVPLQFIKEEVNIVPLDLDWFVQRNANLKKKHAHFRQWEQGEYRGDLVCVPV